MFKGVLGRAAVALVALFLVSAGPGFAGSSGGGGSSTTTNTTTTTNVNEGNINAGTIYEGSITVSGALSASLQYTWGYLAVTSAIVSQLQASLGSTTQTALNFFTNAVGTLPSNAELLTACAPMSSNFLYYEGSATAFKFPTDITDGSNALGIELEAVGGRTYQWSETVSGPSNYAFALSASQTSISTSTDVIRAGDVVLGTNTNILTQITNYTGTANVSVYEVSASKYVSPIVLDMKGQGRLEASGGNWLPHPRKMSKERIVAFDFNANGFEELMEWVGPNDGLLVEPKADRTIDGSCLFGTTGGWTNGFEKLALRDANGDGKLTGEELQGLFVWQDRNGNGRPDEGEVKSVQALGITEINLKHTGYRSTFVMDGRSRVMWDWWPSALHVRKLQLADLPR